MGLLGGEDGIHGIESRVLGKGSWDDKEGIGIGVDTEFSFTSDAGSSILEEMFGACDFERSGSWKDSFVLLGVLDGSETVSDGFLGLGN